MVRTIVVLVMCTLTSGCISSGGFNPMENQSQVQLEKNNYQVTSTGLRGEASVFYLLPFPFAGGGGIPLGDTALATRAMDELVASADMDGKKRGLVNYSVDHSFAYFLLFAVKTVKLRADVVEFQ